MSMHFHLLITPSLTRLLWPRSGCPAPSPRGHVCCQSTPPATASGRGLHWNSAVEFRAGATEAAQAALEEAWKGGNDAGILSCFFLRFFGVFFLPLSGFKNQLKLVRWCLRPQKPGTEAGQVPIQGFGNAELLPPSIASTEEVEEKAQLFLTWLGESIGPTSCYVSWIFPSGMMIRN